MSSVLQTYVEAVIDKIRANIFGAEATDALDLVQLYWWDTQVSNAALWPSLAAWVLGCVIY